MHEAYPRLTPLLSDSSRRLHGWTDEQIEIGIRRLRDDVEHAKAAARADAAPANTSAPSDNQQPQRTTPAGHDTSLAMSDSLWRIENLHARLTELALLLRGHPRLRAAALAALPGVRCGASLGRRYQVAVVHHIVRY